MLYELFQHFDINIFQYITVRAGIAFFIALVLTFVFMPMFIRWAKSKNLEQPIHDLVEKHKSKGRTPTMGGVIFLIATLIASLLTLDLGNFYAISGIITILLFSSIGIQDDMQKVSGKKNSAGISASGKIYIQLLFSILMGLYLYFSGFSTDLYLPFLKNPVLDLGVFFIPFFAMIVISSSNAVNLTDGLDGLATVPSTFAIATLSIFCIFERTYYLE